MLYALVPVAITVVIAVTGLWELTPIALVTVFFAVRESWRFRNHESLAIFILGFFTAVPGCIQLALWQASLLEGIGHFIRLLIVIGYAGLDISAAEILLGFIGRVIWPHQYTELTRGSESTPGTAEVLQPPKSAGEPYFKRIG